MPTYNRAHMISRGIESVINQTYPHWELIIIDDGSTDDTKNVVASYNDSRIRYFWQENQERSVARNNGIEKANGEWICFLDSDDWYGEQYLKTLTKFTHKNSILRTRMAFYDFQENIVSITPSFQHNCTQQYFVASTLGSILHFSIRKDIIQDYSFYRISSWEDKDLLLKILENHSFIDIDHIGIYAREHKDRSVCKFYEDLPNVKKVLIRMQETLSNCSGISSSELITVVDNWVASQLYNLTKETGLSYIVFLKKIEQFKLKYIIRGTYYLLRHSYRKLF